MIVKVLAEEMRKIKKPWTPVDLAKVIVNPEKNPDIVSGFTYSSQGNNILFVSL